MPELPSSTPRWDIEHFGYLGMSALQSLPLLLYSFPPSISPHAVLKFGFAPCFLSRVDLILSRFFVS